MKVCVFENNVVVYHPVATDEALLQHCADIGYPQVEIMTVTPEQLTSMLRTPEVIAKEQSEAQKKADIIDALPSWQQVSDAIDGVTTLNGLKVVVKKLARVVYWLAKNQVN